MNTVFKRYSSSLKKWISVLEAVDVEKTSLDTVLKLFNDCLKDAYEEGFAAVGYQLDDDINRPIDTAAMTAVITQMVGGKSTDARVIEHVLAGDYAMLEVVMNSEWHRVYESAGLDRAMEIDQAIQPFGLRVYKRWIDKDDDFVREAHWRIGGSFVPVTDTFKLIDGDEGLAPGMMGTAQNNANCRCVLEYFIS